MHSSDLKQLTVDLIMLLEKLVDDDLNYFPAIINCVQTSLWHIFSLNNQNLMQALKSGWFLFPDPTSSPKYNAHIVRLFS